MAEMRQIKRIRLFCAVTRPRNLTGVLFSVFLAFVMSQGVAQDAQSHERESKRGWPHLRGPHYNSVSDESGLLDSWPAEGPPVLWIKKLGQGYSGFTIVDGRAYTQTQTLTGQYVVCLNADTGDSIWEHRYGLQYEPLSVYPGPRSTPTFDSNRLYFAAPSGLVGCLDARDGDLIWSLNVKEKFHGRGTDFGYSSSPLIEDGLVILPVGGKGASVVALNWENGSTVWQSGDSPSSYCSAIPITFQSQRHVVAFLQNSLAAFELSKGRLLWEENYSQGYDEHSAMPLYHEPYLMVACPFRGGAHMYRIESKPIEGDSRTDAKVVIRSVWQNRKFSNDVASSVFADGFIYGFDIRDQQSKAHRPSRGEFRCLELETGEIRWSSDQTGHANVIAADGKLILFNDKGEIILLRRNPDRYEELARAQVFGGEICWTAPSLYQGRLFVRSPSQAACIFIGDPDAAQTEQVSHAVPTSAIATSAAWDLTVLLGGEREHPFVRPDFHELGLWYLFCIAGVFPAAIVVTGIANFPGIRRRRDQVVPPRYVTFWISLFAFGLITTPLANRYWPEYIFTWPASLYAVFQPTLIAIVWAESQEEKRKSRRLSRAAGIGLVLVCVGYFYLCRRLSALHEWAFLVGLLPAFPIAVVTARRIVNKNQPLRNLALTALSFSIFFWACGGFMILKSKFEM